MNEIWHWPDPKTEMELISKGPSENIKKTKAKPAWRWARGHSSNGPQGTALRTTETESHWCPNREVDGLGKGGIVAGAQGQDSSP